MIKIGKLKSYSNSLEFKKRSRFRLYNYKLEIGLYICDPE